MKRRTKWALVAFVLGGACLLARAADSPESAVTALEQRLAKACVTADTKVYESLLGDNFRGVNADGSVEGKKRYIGDLGSGTFKCGEYELRDAGCKVIGDVAIFHATVHQKATWNGTDCSGNFQLTDVWAKENGAWRCVHTQWTAVAEK
jgi:hypothetical protein